MDALKLAQLSGLFAAMGAQGAFYNPAQRQFFDYLTGSADNMIAAEAQKKAEKKARKKKGFLGKLLGTGAGIAASFIPGAGPYVAPLVGSAVSGMTGGGGVNYTGAGIGMKDYLMGGGGANYVPGSDSTYNLAKDREPETVPTKGYRPDYGAMRPMQLRREYRENPLGTSAMMRDYLNTGGSLNRWQYYAIPRYDRRALREDDYITQRRNYLYGGDYDF